jgi:ABC-type branched-subunit amino acid transport system substrate-binding protein
MTKITSRKFLISVAAFLASIGSGITGIVTDNNVLTYIGLTCTVVSAAIYAGCEAYVDGKAVASSTTSESTTTVVKKDN